VARPSPQLVEWTDHALAKADRLGIPRSDVEDAILSRHHERTGNTRAADWLIAVGHLAVAYNHPDDDDWLTARVVTLWRPRR
jgi:hypothetical protein